MPKLFRILAAAVAILALTAAPAHAAPVVPLIVGGVNAIFGATVAAAVGNALLAVPSFLLWTAGSIGLSKLMAPKYRSASQERQASVVTLSIGETPREMIVGRAGTGGTLVDAFNYGGPNGTDWECYVIDLADHACDGLEGVWIGDTFVPYTAQGPVTGYNGQLEIYFRHGWNSEEGFPVDFQTRSPALANGKLRGVCKVLWGWKVDAPDAKNPTWPSGRPTVGPWVVRGLRCYDPRKDSTVPGGSGPHRWDDIETHEWTENAELCRYMFSRGVYAFGQVNDPGKLRIGRGLSSYEAPPAREFAAANLCDELVDIGGGVQERRYRVGGVIRSDQPFDEVEEMFAAAMGGVIIQPEGGVAVAPGAARVPVADITDDDLVLGTDMTWNDFASSSTRVNTVVPRYPEPSQKWVETAATVQRDVLTVTAEGPDEEVLSLQLVPFRTQAERLGAIRLRKARLERSAALTVGPRFCHVENGDWVRYKGRRTKGEWVMFEVVSHGLDSSWRNTLQLDETAFSVYGTLIDQTPGQPGEYAPPPDALALAGVSAEAIQISGADGSLVPAVRFGWATPVDSAVHLVRSEIRPVGGGASAFDQTAEVNSGALVTSNGVGAARSVEARLYPSGVPGRPIVPSAWFVLDISGFTANPPGSVMDIINETKDKADAHDALFDEINERLDELAALPIGQLGDIMARLQRLGANATANGRAAILNALSDWQQQRLEDARQRLSGVSAGRVLEHHKLVQDFVVEVLDAVVIKNGPASASLINGTKIQVEDGLSLVQVIQSINTSIGGNGAAIESLQVALTDDREAVALWQQSMRSDFNGFTSLVTSTYVTQANQNSALASLSTSLQSYTNGAIASATSNLTTFANLNQAISNYDTTIKSFVTGGVGAQVSIQGQAISTLQQAFGSLLFKVSSGNNVASLQLLTASGAESISSVKISADVVRFYSPSAPDTVLQFYYDAGAAMLAVENLVVRSANIGTLAVKTLHVEDNAINGSAFGTNSTVQSLNASVEVGSLTYTTSGGKVRIDVSLQTSNPTSSQCAVLAAVYRGDTYLRTLRLYAPGATFDDGGFIIDEFCPAGTYAFRVEARAAGANDAPYLGVSKTAIAIAVSETKDQRT